VADGEKKGWYKEVDPHTPGAIIVSPSLSHEGNKP
jgi:hypothetical protein